MANATASPHYHGALVASTVDMITTNAPRVGLRVVNRDGTAEIYFTTDGTTPTVGGANCNVITAAIGLLEIVTSEDVATVVKLISTGAPKYSISVVR